MAKAVGIHTSGEPKMAFDIDKFVFPKIKTLFVKDPTTKLVIPQLNEDMEWVLQGQGLTTIKIDGVNIKLKKNYTGKITPYKRLKGYSSDGTYVVVSKHDSLDKPIWEAFEALNSKEEGFYEAYGPGINNNPHQVARPLLIKTIPVGGALMVSVNAPGLRIVRGPKVTVQELFDSLRAELDESPEIEGLVFQLEQPSMNPIKFAKIKRKDFGFVWPVVRDITPSNVTVN